MRVWGIYFVSVSTIFLLDFGTVSTVWYFSSFYFITSVYSIWTVTEPSFAYNDVNSYRIFICCQDDNGSSTAYLVLSIKENKIEVPYVTPGNKILDI